MRGGHFSSVQSTLSSGSIFGNIFARRKRYVRVLKTLGQLLAQHLAVRVPGYGVQDVDSTYTGLSK
jgi:hypothetical protein